MKKVLVLSMALVVLCSVAFAETYSSMQIFSQASGTTAQVTGSMKTFRNPVHTMSCDIQSTPTTSVVVVVEGSTVTNALSGTGLSSTHTIISSTTCTHASCYATSVDKPVKAIRALVTSSTNTASLVYVNCTGF